ncbi:MAG: hypothetical protein J6I64_09590, partial [Lachnospiraceae bacterium]|nr:hypothetical protein [Lachnospiraceae bacterium]
MEGGRDRNKETWRVWLWAAVFCLCVLGLATGCGPQNGQHVEGTSQTEMPDESESQVDEVLTAGTGAEDPIPAEPGMRLLEGIYY